LGDEDPNTPPVITVAPVACVSVSSPATLTAAVTDDGLPKPRTPQPRPTAAGSGSAIQRQTNAAAGPRPRGLTVAWFEYGGPARVTFEPPGPLAVVNGRVTTTARFAAPGAYTLVATANDGQLSQRTVVSVSVTAASPGQGKP
jgi:hypothetical protein